MKKFILVAVATLVVACLPTTPLPGLPTPTAVIQATSTSAPTQTETPLPTGTSAPLNPSVTPVVESTAAESTSTSTAFAPPNLTATFSTSTDFPAPVSGTATSTLAPGQPTLTPTLGILKFGTLPPSVPFSNITLLNRSKRQAYISLQVTTIEGYYTIIEYPVAGKVKIKAPLGSYIYVAWVGGNQMTGSFHFSASDAIVITLYKDKVVVSK